MISKFVWFLFTCVIYMSLAVGLWLIGGNSHSDAWYLIAALPVFLFSGTLYLLTRKMWRDMNG